MANIYDAIVLGTGGVGSAALYHLARRGLRVLGIDQFSPGHNRGSSHGETRIIRQAYFEHPDYVPLLLQAYDLWRELESKTGQSLLHEVGLLQVGPPEGVVISGVLESDRRHHLGIEQLSAKETERRFPGFRVPRDFVGVFERRAGYLLVEQCVLAHHSAASASGAEQRCGETVVSWTSRAGGVVVRTDRQEYHAAKLVIAAGPWSPQILSSLGVRLEVRRKLVYWFENAATEYQADRGCPTFLFELPHGVFYGFPAINSLGLKAAEHSGGETIADTATAAQSIDEGDLARVTEFLQNYLPDANRRMGQHSVCFYTMTSDEHFVVDRHPENKNVVFAAGLSGHGFKFTGVLGAALADLAIEGRTDLPISFLSLDRPGLRSTTT